ncbi:MAG: Coenzyme F420 hydrogenase/dehydrogenase, beta subunit C-terminal domain [Eubacterium sp.]|nr:Coenzyme F420 hydrogenase/dehydrogenase, beta subunit C-terminal domain [Eubacterium sp.]
MLDVRRECTGCMACVNRCPVDAISITEDEYGFLVPKIHEDSCINCGQCEAVCPLEEFSDGSKTQEIYRDNSKPIEAWSMYHMSEDIVKKSSSGGAFYGLAKHIIDQGGIVFGCYYDIKKKRAVLEDTDHMPLDSLLTSKYVENDISRDGLRKVENEVQTGRQVLFCGTPCQAAGLRSYMKHDYENLLIVDFACGGVAAQPYLSNYLSKLERDYDSGIVRMTFRDKHYGWGQYCFLAEFENGRIYRKTAMSDPYFFCFLKSSMQRLSCHGCHFSADHRSDICLSDFWKCDHFEVDRNDRRGLSLVLIYTEKGQRMIKSIRDHMHMEELPFEEASYHLKPRFCPESKLEEIHRDMKTAYTEGVEVLRNRLLSEEQKTFYDERQRIMDDKKSAIRHPEIVGKGQIM